MPTDWTGHRSRCAGDLGTHDEAHRGLSFGRTRCSCPSAGSSACGRLTAAPPRRLCSSPSECWVEGKELSTR
eukprot:ctg_940.g396